MALKTFTDNLHESGAISELLHDIEASGIIIHPTITSLCHALKSSWTVIIAEPSLHLASSHDNCMDESGANGLSSGSWAQIALDYSWEMLHTGHWKDVNLVWRQCYALAALLKVVSLARADKLEEALVITDKGILMGAPILNNSLQALATIITGEISPEKVKNIGADDIDRENTRTIGKVRFRNYKPSGSSMPETKKLSLSPSSCSMSSYTSIPLIDMTKRISVVHSPSLEQFRQCHMIPSLPVVLSGAMEHWPAYAEKRWK